MTDEFNQALFEMKYRLRHYRRRITAIGVGVGALYPKFDHDHAAEIPTSFGGVVCMIFSIGFIGVTVMIEAWPVYLLAMEGLAPSNLGSSEFRVIIPSLVAVLILTVFAVTVPLKLGLKNY